MSERYADLTRDQLIALLRRRDLSRKLGLVWERNEIEHEKILTEDLPLVKLETDLSNGDGPWTNLLMEGDNFHALRTLRAVFKGRFKCIYIDPPYNTGNKDFVYNDAYMDRDDAYRHSTWLEFLYRRLALVRDLLREDGVLLVSINDENRAYLELLLDQIWPGGKKGSFVWRSRTGDNSGTGANLSVNHEHILVWANSLFRFRGDDKTYAMYSNPDHDPRGDWASSDTAQPKDWIERSNAFYPVCNPENDIWYPPNPDQVWRFASESKLDEDASSRKETMEELIRQKRIIFPKEGRFAVWNTLEELREAIGRGEVPKDGTGGLLIREGIPLIDLSFWVGKKIGFGAPRYKRFKSELSETTQPLSSWIKAASEKDFQVDDDAVHIASAFTDEGSKELRRQLGDKAFPYPKPPSLLRGLLSQSTSPDDLVLDFFAGSGTTAQAVAELNAEDGGTRRFVLVSSTEATAAEPDKNICRDVAARRLKALGLNFAYLRSVTHPAAAGGRGVDDALLWTSLQLLYLGSVAREADPEAGLLTAEGDDILLCYARRVDRETLAVLEQTVPAAGKTLVILSFQPGPLAQKLGHRQDLRVETLPDALNAALLGSTGVSR